VRRCWIEYALSRSQFARRLLEEVGTKTLRYIYDFGDGWKHTIKIEQLTDPASRTLSTSDRSDPSRRLWRPWGYAEFLDAISDPAHERHAELKEWIGCDFDPDNVDTEELVAHVAMLRSRADPGPTTHWPRVAMLDIAATRRPAI
jgi:hypothetical protein